MHKETSENWDVDGNCEYTVSDDVYIMLTESFMQSASL